MIDSRLKKGLGRGLSSLLGDSTQKIETNKVPIKDIIRNKFQPRKNIEKESLEELTNSIKEQGVIQPQQGVILPHVKTHRSDLQERAVKTHRSDLQERVLYSFEYQDTCIDRFF